MIAALSVLRPTASRATEPPPALSLLRRSGSRAVRARRSQDRTSTSTRLGVRTPSVLDRCAATPPRWLRCPLLRPCRGGGGRSAAYAAAQPPRLAPSPFRVGGRGGFAAAPPEGSPPSPPPIPGNFVRPSGAVSACGRSAGARTSESHPYSIIRRRPASPFSIHAGTLREYATREGRYGSTLRGKGRANAVSFEPRLGGGVPPLSFAGSGCPLETLAKGWGRPGIAEYRDAVEVSLSPPFASGFVYGWMRRHWLEEGSGRSTGRRRGSMDGERRRGA